MTTLLTTAIVIGMLESAECSGRCAWHCGHSSNARFNRRVMRGAN
ncbi:hypothetical protein [Burkholderia vietnamiensis]|nr:hypothetical protein [Burkholderia vietnamiensis]